jgi:small subunit ribosomal protein S4
MHGKRRAKLSEYGIQLREKQKVRRVYGMLEGQFKRLFQASEKKSGVTSEIFFKNLELRLDNVVYRMGLSRSRSEARQVVKHNHIFVNGKRCNVPSLTVRVGDEISVKEGSREMPTFVASAELFKRRLPLNWFEVDHTKFSGKVVAEPQRDDIQLAVTDRLIVELYSK